MKFTYTGPGAYRIEFEGSEVNNYYRLEDGVYEFACVSEDEVPLFVIDGWKPTEFVNEKGEQVSIAPAANGWVNVCYYTPTYSILYMIKGGMACVSSTSYDESVPTVYIPPEIKPFTGAYREVKDVYRIKRSEMDEKELDEENRTVGVQQGTAMERHPREMCRLLWR